MTHGRVEGERDSTKCLLCTRYAGPPNPFRLAANGVLEICLLVFGTAARAMALRDRNV